MTCTQCNRANLPGGIRCAYCGTYLPQALEFDLGDIPETSEEVATEPESLATSVAAPPQLTGLMGKAAGLLAPLALLALKAKSLLGLLKLGKIATTLFSMLVFIWVDAQIFGWKFGVGIAVSIFIHEMGHVFVNWRYKLPQSAPVFIPFVGAAIFLKGFPDNPRIQAESGAGGPIAGFLAAVACLGIYFVTHDSFWLSLANFGFMVNLFNLIPFPPLDGSHIHTVFSPGIWNVVLASMLLWAIKFPSGMLWMILIIGVLMRLSYKDDGRYLRAPSHIRVRMAVVYLVLCLSMSWASDFTMSARPKRPTANRLLAFAPKEDESRPRATTSDSIAPKDSESNSPTNKDPLSKGNSTASPIRTLFQWGLRGVMLLLGGLLWLGVVALLARSQKRRWTRDDGKFLAGMLISLLFMEIAAAVLPMDVGAKWGILGAFFVGTLLSLGFSAFCAISGFKKQGVVPTPSALRMRTSTVMVIGVLLVAYASFNGWIFVAALLGIGVFYGLHRWMMPASLGQITIQFGDSEKALIHFERAANHCPEADEKAYLWHKIAQLSLSLDRAANALTAQESAEHLWTSEGEDKSRPSFITAFEKRVSALGQLGRFDDALLACEQVLSRAASDEARAPVLIPLAEVFVHLSLARLALWRGWHDETIAQADWCLKRVAPSAVQVRANLHGLHADALIGQAEQLADEEQQAPLLEQARVACDLSENQIHEIANRAYIATLRARIAAMEGDSEKAAAFAKLALELQPAHLACRYWYGRFVDSTFLNRLASDFPKDRWGRLAAQ